LALALLPSSAIAAASWPPRRLLAPTPPRALLPLTLPLFMLARLAPEGVPSGGAPYSSASVRYLFFKRRV
jgi:hypothetical protein